MRTSSPRGQQCSTYWLQLPCRYSIPLIIMSSFLYWPTSQSLFLARIDVYKEDGTVDENQSASTCGYSAIAIIFVLIASAIAVLCVVAISVRKFKPGIPLVGSCIAAISAACHRPEADNDASTKPVRCRVAGLKFNHEVGKTVGHCSFTSFVAKRPVEGRLYAGWGSKNVS